MSPAARPLRVMVIDDNVQGAHALGNLLEAMGCSTAVAFDGTQGLAGVLEFRPDLAFIDLEMPGLSGTDVASRLRARVPASSARLVCVTGRGQPEDRRSCLAAGFDDFVTKPMPIERLDQMVATANAELCRSDPPRG